jgi:surfeit locus 1 family protein
VAGVLLFAGFSGLGVWQLERLAWKRDLIARVDARVHAAPTEAPGPTAWSRITASRDEYRRVRLTGVYENDKETLVQAVTVKGPGFWVMTPFRTDAGYVVLVNRGFTPPELSAPASRAPGQIGGHASVTGLLRMSEPHGGFLRTNQPAAGRWYSRDVAAIAAARGVTPAAPYFVDADATPNNGGWPLGGLTVINFRNSHLSYALTWFALAGMTALWGAWPALTAARRRRAGGARLAQVHGPRS